MASFSIYRQIFLTITLALAYGTAFITADVSISHPISSQLPPIAYAGKPYTFSLARDTFSFSVPADAKAPSSPPSIAYNVEDLPSWLKFDAASLTFTGTPPDQDAGKTVQIPVEGSLTSSTGGSSGNTSATEDFDLPIINEPAPVVNIPIVKQLSSASSLGPSKMLAADTIHLPLGWSFSIGLQGDTFTIPTGQRVYWSANLADGSALPTWLTFSADSYDFYGVAPNNVGPQGEEYDVVITGSNRAGYGGTTQTFKLVIGSNALGLMSQTLPAANASVGTYFQYQIPIDGLKSQGRKLTDSDSLTVNSTVSSDLSWLTFEQSNRTFYGIPPYDPYGNASSVTNVQIPVTFSGTNSTDLTVNQTISIQPSLFTALQLPNVFIGQSSTVNIDLSQYLRNTTSARKRGSSKRFVRAVLAAQPNFATPNVSVSYNPENTSSWLHYDASTLTLNGQVPKGWTDRSQITLEAPENGNAMSKASFYLAFQGDNAMGAPTNGKGGNGGNGNGSGGSGLSKTAKVAIGASLGAIGAVAALIALFACCRRRYDNDIDQSRQENFSRAPEDDEGTLTDAPKTKKWKKAIVIGRAGVGEMGTPSTAVPSPMPGFDEKMHEKNVSPNQGDLHSVVVVSPNGRRRNAMEEAEAPMQSRLITNLFGGHGKEDGRSKKRGSKMSQANSNGTGLGLSMGDSGEIDPFAAGPEHGRIRHQRSRQSVNSQRSSWESDLFYEDAPSQQHGSSEQHDGHEGLTMPSSEMDDMPRRRGKPTTRSGTGLNVRHRNTHINESPAFSAPDAFVAESIPGTNSSRSNLDGVGMAAMDSNFSMEGEYLDSQTGQTPGRLGESDARILKARVMQVQRHSPVLHQGSNNPFATPSVGRQGNNYSSARPYHVDGGEAFDDAEDDDEWPASEGHAVPVSRQYKQGKQNNRNSVMSAMTDASQLAGVRAHYANEAAMEAEMDGASISAFDPRETVKPVMARPQTPPQQQNATRSAQKIKIIPTTPKTPKRAPGSSGSASGKYLPCPPVEAVIGHLLRFRMYPNTPPPLAGAPGSPGKRSGRTVRYELTMLDDRPHLAKYKNQWPVMMSDWLSIDTSTFEVEGVVPRIAELEQLGDCEIGLISTTRISGNPNSPERNNNTPQNKRSSVSSYESGGRTSISNDEERTVVARARLVFQNAAPRIFVPKHGHAF
ncbi:uncharacterized protein FA14DRAFT_177629 [Meira miltonrushii]|uniref:Dystroglycan-type cadherin-like domain-containing protein n=1 Tax=Meira miltonrushii TaxID=1280837 RepID=A0A316VLC4_9BASI|nr:uncharacterized protein FA14DRAFT_177629 [Meira miltonrushii]PWN38356.1 hypothetical protein FA14DRAFT_177629 [Meira miltonrushii]